MQKVTETFDQSVKEGGGCEDIKMCAAFYYEKNGPNFAIGDPLTEPASLSSLPFDRRHYKKDSRFVNDLYTLTYDDHESLDSVRLFSTFANQVSVNYRDPMYHFQCWLRSLITRNCD